MTAPKSATTLGFRLQKWLVYEVVKGSWAESVGLKLGALVDAGEWGVGQDDGQIYGFLPGSKRSGIL